MRSRVRDLGIVGTPCCRHQRTRTWAGVRPTRPGDLRDRRVVQQRARGRAGCRTRAPRRAPGARAPRGRVDQRVPLDLVHRRRHLGPRHGAAQEVEAVVRDADGPGQAVGVQALELRPAGPARARPSGSGRGQRGRARACGGCPRAACGPSRGRAGAWSSRRRRRAAGRSPAGPRPRPPRCRRPPPCRCGGSRPPAPRPRPARSRAAGTRHTPRPSIGISAPVVSRSAGAPAMASCGVRLVIASSRSARRGHGRTIALRAPGPGGVSPARCPPSTSARPRPARR